MVRLAALLVFTVVFTVLAQAQNLTHNYPVPDPLTLADAQPVKDAATWTTQRRPELIRLFEENVYGKTPAGHTDIRVMPPLVDLKALKGKAVRKQVTIYCSD